MNLIQELRQAARRLARRPLFAFVAVATLAVGIGANTAVFSLLEAAVLRELPVPGAERLMQVRERNPDGGLSNIGFATYVDLSERLRSFESLAVTTGRSYVVSGDGVEPSTLAALGATATWLPTLGVAPELGRNFVPEEDRPGAPRVAILGHAYWLRALGGDPAVIGRTIVLDSRPHEIVGVLPASVDRGFGPGAARRLDLVTPLRYSVDLPYACRDCRHLRAFGRLRPTSELAIAQAELDTAIGALAATYPDRYPVPSGAVEGFQDVVTQGARPLLRALSGGVALVLLLSIANVAALLTVRAIERERELAICRALGAGGRVLARSAWSEALILNLLGAAAGVVLAKPLLALFAARMPAALRSVHDPELSLSTLGFALGATLVAALLVGMAPAWMQSRSSVATLLAGSSAAGGTKSRRRSLARLVVAELALALAVVFAAVQLARSVERLLAEDPGFRPEGVTVASVAVSGPLTDDRERLEAFFAEAAGRIDALPGVVATGWTSQLPLGGNFDTYGLRFEDRPAMRLDEEPAADRYAVTPGYFEALGLRLVAGRFLEATDRAGVELVALVSRRLAETIWPDESPIGKRLRAGGDDAPWRTIVGVVDDVRHMGLDQPSAAQFYVPAEQWEFGEESRTLVVRTTGDPRPVSALLAPTLHALDRSQPIERIRQMTDVVDESLGGRRFASGAWWSFAAIALLLALVGTYGLLARDVELRQRELGVRSAVGASPRDLVGLVFRRAARIVAAAIVLALPICWAAGKLLAAQLWQLPSLDPLSLGGAAAALTAVGILAALVPGARAGRIDPAATLRPE